MALGAEYALCIWDAEPRTDTSLLSRSCLKRGSRVVSIAVHALVYEILLRAQAEVRMGRTIRSGGHREADGRGGAWEVTMVL